MRLEQGLSDACHFLLCSSGSMATEHVSDCTHYGSLPYSLTILAIVVPTEGLPHSVSGAGVREPQSGAGYQKQTAPPAGNEADGTRQTGQTWGR